MSTSPPPSSATIINTEDTDLSNEKHDPDHSNCDGAEEPDQLNEVAESSLKNPSRTPSDVRLSQDPKLTSKDDRSKEVVHTSPETSSLDPSFQIACATQSQSDNQASILDLVPTPFNIER